MTERDVIEIIDQGAFPGNGKGNLVETHISWVILTKQFAFKIKKPVSFSFLDFTTLAKRKHFCEKELRLNSRLARDTYLAVLPVREHRGRLSIGGAHGKTVDYAVQMKRLLRSREMTCMLKAGKVSAAHVRAIAEVLSPFHRKAQVIDKPFDTNVLKTLFYDIVSVTDFMESVSKGSRKIIHEAVRISDTFLRRHKAAFAQRAKDGFIRDCHGDLHSGNIFLYKKPVIFDCLEFNDSFRHIDIINELAFFCMDLEEYRREDLSRQFMDHYNKLFPVIRNKSDNALFQYYKLYRANIRTKVNALKAMQAKNEGKLKKRTALVLSYLRLMERCIREM